MIPTLKKPYSIPPASCRIAGVVIALGLATGGALKGQELEQGLTLRVYDVREEMDRMYPLVPGQVSDIDEKRDIIDFTTTADFGGLEDLFMTECIAKLEITSPGLYGFRLTSDDGSALLINDHLVISHDGLHAGTAEEGSQTLAAGLHPLLVRHFDNYGDQRLLLEWKPPGSADFTVIPASAYKTPANAVRLVNPGKKEILRAGDGRRPGHGMPLSRVHPAWRLHTIRPETFRPQVGALALHEDGRLFVATFDPNQFGIPTPAPGGDGKIYALSGTEQDDRSLVTVAEVADGLSEPLGMTFVDGELYVSQRLELTRLKDLDEDGYYETHETVSSGWTADNFHHFHFGAVEKDGFMYTTLSATVDIAYSYINGYLHQGLNGANPPNRGTLVRTNLATGEKSYMAGGLRTPNGIAIGPEGIVVGCDNQGAWHPASRLNVYEEGKFYGHYNDTVLYNWAYPTGGSPSLFFEEPITPPALYLPQGEICNSATQPLLIPDGLFAGQMYLGELTLGGINRVSLEKVNGVWQGCALRFCHGFEVGVHRLIWGPDGSLYIGGIGALGNWSWNGTLYGLQRISPRNDGTEVYEIKNMRALSDGFEVEYTMPVEFAAAHQLTNYEIKQYRYQGTAAYGGEKLDETILVPTSATLSADQRKVRLTVPGLQSGYVQHLKADLPSKEGRQLWSTEAWYTMNEIPALVQDPITNVRLDFSTIAENQPAGSLVGTLAADSAPAGGEVSYSLVPNVADNDSFELDGSALRAVRSFDFETRSSYEVLVRATNTSGYVTDTGLAIAITDDWFENPAVSIFLSSYVVPPGTPAGSSVGRLCATDVDAGDKLEIGSTSAFASQLIAWEDFGGLDRNLLGATGGSGFGSEWITPVGQSTKASGMAFQDASDAVAVRFLDTDEQSPFEPYLNDARKVGRDGTTLYISYRMRALEFSPEGRSVVAFLRGGDLAENVQFHTGRGPAVALPRDGLVVGSDPIQLVLGANADDGEFHRHVLKVEFGAGDVDQVTFYRDPLSETENGIVGQLGASDLSFDRIGFASLGGASVAIDDIRFADNFAAVTAAQTSKNHTFSLVPGAGSQHNDMFEVVGDQIVLRTSLAAGLYSVRVRASDTAGLSFEQSMPIYVGNGASDIDRDGAQAIDEILAGLNPDDEDDLQIDTDMDGQTNGEELESGSDPFDRASVFRAKFSGSAVTATPSLQWPSRRDQVYSVMQSPDLMNWTPVGSSMVAGEGSLSTFFFDPAQITPPRRFYQVHAGAGPAGEVDLMAGGLAAWEFVNLPESEWTYDSETQILRHTRGPNDGWIRFPQTYENFVLRLAYHLPEGGDSGIFVRGLPGTPEPSRDGVEVQLKNSDVRGEVFETGALAGRLAAFPPQNPVADEWHEVEVRVIGQHYRVMVDGAVLINVQNADQGMPQHLWPASGLIGLQGASADTPSVEFKAIRVHSLP